MADLEVLVTDTDDPGFAARIEEGLNQYNEEQAGYRDRRPLTIYVRERATGAVVGGLSGRTSLGLLFIDLFYLPPRLRGSGLGSEVLRRAEDEGRARGCRSAVLYTISFQAPDFYRKHGWQVFGEVPCEPPGTARVFLSKDLRPVSSSDGPVET